MWTHGLSANDYQEPASMSGIGLHTGVTTTDDLQTCSRKLWHPIPAVLTFRISPEIPADVDHVVISSEGTTLGNWEYHCAYRWTCACCRCRIASDNLVLLNSTTSNLYGDGSAKPSCRYVAEARVRRSGAPKDYLIIDQLSIIRVQPAASKL